MVKIIPSDSWGGRDAARQFGEVQLANDGNETKDDLGLILRLLFFLISDQPGCEIDSYKLLQ